VRSNRNGVMGVIENDRRLTDPTSNWLDPPTRAKS